MNLSLFLPVFSLMSITAIAAPLTGSGANLPLPATGSTSPGIAPALVESAGSFTGTWSSPAPSAWLGTFTATGDYPRSGFTGTSVWNFSGLAAGNLPSGTYVRFSDLDSGTHEAITLRAFDASNAAITSAWLDEPVFLAGSTPGDFLQTNLPSWNLASGVYTFTGASFNTLLTLSLQTNTALTYLQVEKAHVNNGFGLAAPTSDVPEPGTMAMMAMGVVAVMVGRRRR